MKRKLLTGLLAAVLASALLVPVRAEGSPFTDVTPSDAYYDAVIWALENRVTTGATPTQFLPGESCTRGQVVTFLWRAQGCPEPQTARNPFSDVPSGLYCEKAVLWAVEEGITTGTTPSTFSPDMTCTEAHILTFLWRSQGGPELEGTGRVEARFPAGYYSAALRWAEDLGLLTGMEDVIEIDVPCSRAQTVVFLYGALTPWDPVVIQRQAILDEGAMCGAVLVGTFPVRGENEVIHEREAWDQIFEDAGLTEGFPFLRSIPNGNIVQSPGGHEVYLILPLDPGASVAVDQWIVNESNGYQGEIGQVLYRSDTGAPLLLVCNRRDDMPDTQVTVVDSEGQVMTWNPGLSLENGRIDTKTLRGPAVADLTVYPKRP